MSQPKDRSPAQGTDTTVESLDTDLRGAAPFGPYRLLQRLGAGGMGEVWLAEQAVPVHRQVALKVIKPGMDSSLVIGRFEAERQALALMAHPAIAAVFDGGSTTQGRPYFAMEYVKGEAITTYCDRHRLTTDERLALFLQVCEGQPRQHRRRPRPLRRGCPPAAPERRRLPFVIARPCEYRLGLDRSGDD